MVIGTSAIIAILSLEPEAEHIAAALAADSTRLISAASLLETAIVVEARYGLPGGRKLDEMLRVAQLVVEPVTAEQVTIARLAYRSFGRGRHPAALNFGDCFAYALSKLAGEPLLFKGNDFSQTDLATVAWQT